MCARSPATAVVTVCDGGGGASPGGGAGLKGLADRVAALDGRLTVGSPAGGPPRCGRRVGRPDWELVTVLAAFGELAANACSCRLVLLSLSLASGPSRCTHCPIGAG